MDQSAHFVIVIADTDAMQHIEHHADDSHPKNKQTDVKTKSMSSNFSSTLKKLLTIFT